MKEVLFQIKSNLVYIKVDNYICTFTSQGNLEMIGRTLSLTPLQRLTNREYEMIN